MPTTLGPDSSGAVVAGTSGCPVVDEPETAAIAFSRWGCAAAVAESIYGFAAACAEARYCWPVAIADWTTPPGRHDGLELRDSAAQPSRRTGPSCRPVACPRLSGVLEWSRADAELAWKAGPLGGKATKLLAQFAAGLFGRVWSKGGSRPRGPGKIRR